LDWHQVEANVKATKDPEVENAKYLFCLRTKASDAYKCDSADTMAEKARATAPGVQGRGNAKSQNTKNRFY